MQALKEYWKLYLILILCFATAAFLAAALDPGAESVNGEGGRQVIYVDPGHGGEDGGAVSVTGVLESSLNLDISLRLKDLLQLCGMSTKMTREGEYAIYDDGCDTLARKKASDLRKRAALLQQEPGAILLSIHQNQFTDPQYHGAQVFYNAAEESQGLAKSMQNALRQGLDAENHRETKLAKDIYLMEEIDNTAILIECGFLSNREEEEKLRSAAYQKELACAISAGLLNFITEKSLL